MGGTRNKSLQAKLTTRCSRGGFAGEHADPECSRLTPRKTEISVLIYSGQTVYPPNIRTDIPGADRLPSMSVAGGSEARL